MGDIRLQQQREKSIDSYNKKLAASERAAEPYNQLTTSLRNAEQQAANLGAQFGATSPQFLDAARNVRTLRTEVDAIEQPLGKFQIGVRNYSGAF